MAPTRTKARQASPQPPEPKLTPAELIQRATALRPLLRARQADCEALGNVPADVNAQLVQAGFYRTIQPRRFGGYEFDVPTFYRVMIEIARGCAETGWVVALTSGHPLVAAAFSEEAQCEVYGAAGEFRCPAAFTPPGKAIPVDGGYRISGAWPSASGIDHSTHFVTMAAVADDGASPGAPPRAVLVLFDRSQYQVRDDWQVMGMQGTGSKTVVASDVFVPEHLTASTKGLGRVSDVTIRGPDLYSNPMYTERIGPFLIGETAAVAVGAAYGALDLYEEMMRTKAAPFPPHLERFKDPEFQHHYGRALALTATAEAALIRAGEDFMDYAREDAAGGAPFDDAREQRLTLIELQSIQLAWEAVELIYRTAGTTAAVKQGQPIGRFFRNLAAIRTHPALQFDRTAMAAARTRFGVQQSGPGAGVGR